MTLTDELASAAVRWSHEAQEDAQLGTHLEMLLADWLACQRAGRRDEAWPRDCSPVSVAASLASASHRLDRDDVHWDLLIHPGSVVWPAVFAVADDDTSGSLLKASAAVGYEVMARVASALGSSHSTRWHSTATSGIVGAAAAAGLVSGLSESGLAAALGHASSVMGGLRQALLERSRTREFHRSYAAAMGVLAAQFAREAPDATRLGWEGDAGVFRILSEDSRPEELSKGRATWAVAETGIRVYPASGFFQSVVHCIRLLRSDHPYKAADEILLSVPDAIARAADPFSTDSWWRLDITALKAWIADCEQALDRVDLDGAHVPKVSVEVRDPPVGMFEVEVAVRTGREVSRRMVNGPPGLARDDVKLARKKWASMNQGEYEALDIARALISSDSVGAWTRGREIGMGR